MEIAHLNRATKVSRSMMRELSDHLMAELSGYLQIELKCLKRHIVEGESCVSTVYGKFIQSGPFNLCVDGVLLIQMRDGTPPKVDSELCVFSQGERIGPRQQGGNSYYSLHCGLDGNVVAWEARGWLGDGPDDWERITQPRISAYPATEETWEDNA